MTIDGKRRKVPPDEAVLAQIAQRALTGDQAAAREILKLRALVVRNQPVQKPEDTLAPVRLIIHYGCPAMMKALEILDVVTEANTKDTRLRTWAIQAAQKHLGRRWTPEEEAALNAVWEGNKEQ